MSFKLNIFTLNIWDMPFGLSKSRRERISAISEALAAKDYDIICLQEIWVQNDFNLIFAAIKRQMPYKYYFYSGLLGSGLGIVSKWPIVSTFYYKFPLNGYIHKIHHGDWFGGKGVALTQINFNGKIINVFNTHLHAQYCLKDTDDEYLVHRLSQAYEIGKLVRLCSESGALTLLVGDCNSKPSDICFQLLRALGGLDDSFLESKSEEVCGTNESLRNSFTSPEALANNPHGSRIDYILYRSNSGHSAKTLFYQFALPSRIPGKGISYSDHEAIEATIEVTENRLQTTSLGSLSELDPVIQQNSIKVCDNGIEEVLIKRRRLLIYSVVYIVIIALIPQIADYLNLFTLNSLLPYIFFALVICFVFQFAFIHIELRSVWATKMALSLLNVKSVEHDMLIS